MAKKRKIYIQCKDFNKVTSSGKIYTAWKKQFKLKEVWKNRPGSESVGRLCVNENKRHSVSHSLPSKIC